MKKMSPAFLRSLADKASKNWRVRVNPRDSSMFFLEADRLKSSDPYAVEVFGDDVTLYPEETRMADMLLAATLRNNLQLIIELLEKKDG